MFLLYISCQTLVFSLQAHIIGVCFVSYVLSTPVYTFRLQLSKKARIMYTLILNRPTGDEEKLGQVLLFKYSYVEDIR